MCEIIIIKIIFIISRIYKVQSINKFSKQYYKFFHANNKKSKSYLLGKQSQQYLSTNDEIIGHCICDCNPSGGFLMLVIHSVRHENKTVLNTGIGSIHIL